MKQLLMNDGFIINNDNNKNIDDNNVYINCSGAYRPMLQRVIDGNITKLSKNNDNNDDNEIDVIINMKLKSGCYATTMLRELLHNNNIM